LFVSLPQGNGKFQASAPNQKFSISYLCGDFTARSASTEEIPRKGFETLSNHLPERIPSAVDEVVTIGEHMHLKAPKVWSGHAARSSGVVLWSSKPRKPDMGYSNTLSFMAL